MRLEIGRYRRYRTPFLAFGGTWLVALGLLAVRGRWGWIRAALGEAMVLGLFVVLTFWLTRDRPLPEARSDGSAASHQEPGSAEGRLPGGPSDGARRRWMAQLAVAVMVAVLTVIRFWEIPGWSAFIDALYGLARALPVPAPNYLVNPVLYVLLPGVAVLALGAGRREIGFRRGWRSWRVTAVWSAPVVAAWVYYVATGQAAVGRILGAAASNLFQNGFGEEFLWRGVIQTRIARLWTPEWGLVLASLGFGFWHIDSIPDWTGGDLWIAAALNVVIQAPMGLAMGVLFDRTRNLLAPTIAHVMANTVAV